MKRGDFFFGGLERVGVWSRGGEKLNVSESFSKILAKSSLVSLFSYSTTIYEKLLSSEPFRDLSVNPFTFDFLFMGMLAMEN